MGDPRLQNQASKGQIDKVKVSIKQEIRDPVPTFYRMIILETIPDPNVSSVRKSYWKNILRVNNMQYEDSLPRNTIIAQPILGRQTLAQPMFIFPFFPSHLALPCKPGEMVWVMFEDPNASQREIGYWFCRISEPHFVDDVNHTHHAAGMDMTRIPTKKEENAKKLYQMRNGKVLLNGDGSRSVDPNSRVIMTDRSEADMVFEDLITETDAAQMTQYEPIPRFKKRPGDVALEGSNNTLIVLGTDRIGPHASYSSDNVIVPIPQEKIGDAGSIDIVAGRGTLPATKGNVVATTSIISDDVVLKNEIDKDNPVAEEGDPDFANDRSRILVSQKTNVDTNFKLDSYNFSNYGIADSLQGDAAVVIKSDKIRIIARSDISLIVTNFEVESVPYSPGSAIVDNVNQNKWASITIKTNGDIVFTPSEEGIIKLGGDDANNALVCTEFVARNENGTVKALPIATTGGGFIGTSGNNVDKDAVAFKKRPDFGKIATKILVK